MRPVTPPPAGPALTHPPTARVVRWLVGAESAALALSVVGLLVAAVLAGPVAFWFVPLPVAIGVHLWLVLRTRRRLAAAPWRPRTVLAAEELPAARWRLVVHQSPPVRWSLRWEDGSEETLTVYAARGVGRWSSARPVWIARAADGIVFAPPGGVLLRPAQVRNG